MKLVQEKIKALLQDAAQKCFEDGVLPSAVEDVPIELPKRPEHGDFASTIALSLAKSARRPPRELATALVDRISDTEGMIESASVAGPGFINLKLTDDVWYAGLGRVLEGGESWGKGEPKDGPKVLLEFVSANPTGPLHVGHGRGAAVGDTLARILRFAGYPVATEYYLNDSGRQVELLGKSVWIRALTILRTVKTELDPRGEGFAWLTVPGFPEDGYHGAYVKDLAAELIESMGAAVAELDPEGGLDQVRDFAVAKMREAIGRTLERFNVHFDVWTSERELHQSGAIQTALDELKARGCLREQDGAVWFTSIRFGDDKDRVVVRENGEPTYFAADIGYHAQKFARGFQRLINIWGADHHGYVARMKAAVQALGHSPEDLEALLNQFVTLTRGGRKQAMGKRSGQFVTVDELIEEVGTDVMRYFFVERRYDSHIEFDLEVALSQDPTVNPALYVQYGHARACSILRKARAELGVELQPFSTAVARRLSMGDEISIIRRLMDFPTLVSESAEAREPHRIVGYLLELSRQFQSYYTRMKSDPVLPQKSVRKGDWKDRWDWDKTHARLLWVEAMRIVFRNGLTLLGLNAPEQMSRLEEPESGAAGP